MQEKDNDNKHTPKELCERNVENEALFIEIHGTLHPQYNTEVSLIWYDLFINNLILKFSHIDTILLKNLIEFVWI